MDRAGRCAGPRSETPRRVGNLTRLTDADGIATSYTYDARNRLDTVTTAADVTRYAWWEDGLLKSVLYPNNTLQDRGAAGADDRAYRLRSVVNGPNLAATPFSAYRYTYDKNGNRLAQVETQRDLSAGQPVTTTYAYDNLNRVHRGLRQPRQGRLHVRG